MRGAGVGCEGVQHQERADVDPPSVQPTGSGRTRHSPGQDNTRECGGPGGHVPGEGMAEQQGPGVG